MNRVFQYDVFLSFSSKDRLRVEKLAERLKDEGIKVWYDDWEIQFGDDIFLKIERGLEDSQSQILVMSNNAFESDWVTLERNTTLFRDPTNKDRRFIPLLLEDCDIRDTIRRFRYVDWRNEDESEYKKLIKMMLPGSNSTTRSIRDRDWLRQPLSNVNRHVLYGSISQSNDVQFWFSGSAGWLDKEALIIIFYMEPGLTETVAKQCLKDTIARSGIEWLTSTTDVWILRADVLRKNIGALKDFRWLNGNLAAESIVAQEPLILSNSATDKTTVTFAFCEV